MIDTTSPELPLRAQPGAAGGRGPRPRPPAGARRRGLGEDARAHHPDRPPDRPARRAARPDLRGDLHQQGRGRDEAADRPAAGARPVRASGSARSIRSPRDCSGARRELLGFTRQFTIYDEDDRLSLIKPPDGSARAFHQAVPAARGAVAHLGGEEPDGAAVGARRRVSQFDRLAAGLRRRVWRPWARRSRRRTRWTSTTCCCIRSRSSGSIPIGCGHTSAGSASSWWTSSRTPTGRSTS